MEQVILVNPDDREIGTAEKLSAHRDGLLHRAFSVLIDNDRGDMLLQRRAAGKYHSAGLWSNACCGHPRPNEDVRAAAERRLMEEMGFTVPLAAAFQFLYKESVGPDLVEHELDHVLAGRFNGVPTPNTEEVSAWRWVAPGDLQREITERPAQFTVWFRRIVEMRAAGSGLSARDSPR